MKTKCFFKKLALGVWNIQGLYEKVNGVRLCKLDEDIFQRTLKRFDIFCLQETHMAPGENIYSFNDFYIKPHCRRKSSNNRHFGGLLLFIRKSIKEGVKIREIFDEDALEVTLKKCFFGLQEDINILFIYASPLNSCYTKSRTNMLDITETRIRDEGGQYIIMGDLNGRTRLGEDFVRDHSDKHSPINIPNYLKDEILSRQNEDKHVIDQQGKLILDLCKSSSLRILNGRTHGDKTGKFTRYPINPKDNPSAIDYALCGNSVMREIESFSILPFTGLSDHCCISVNININVDIMEYNEYTFERKEQEAIKCSKIKYTYDSSRKHIFEYNLQNDTNLKILSNNLLNKTDIDSDEVNNNIAEFENIILLAARKSFPVTSKRGSKQKSKKWFSGECVKYRKVLRECSRNLSRNPFNREKLTLFSKARMAYKKICRKSEKEYRRFLTGKLMNIGQRDPKQFWSIINKMNNWGKERTDPTEQIRPNEWVKYFKMLLKDGNEGASPDGNFSENLRDGIYSNTHEGHNTFEPILDSRITVTELREALSELKPGKAPGPDGILVEYLKIFGGVCERILLKLVRLLFSNHLYPSNWTLNFLKPIYKKGDVKDPNNYRGIAIGSAFAKLFSQILLKRLIKYINLKNIISPKQIGFMQGCRTSDHIFLLQTIVEKVVKNQKGKLYAAFIDFKKAYDTVNRDLLLERLKALGINGIFLRNVEAMYKRTGYFIKVKSGHLENKINSNLGLKQGCPLSPMLFNLYIDDIEDMFDEDCEPVCIQNERISHFLYADDLVLLSHSSGGLQRCLDRLAGFSKDKQLTINTDKSKTMVFNQTGKFFKTNFTVDGKKLEPVQTFCYLGFDLKSSGAVKHAMNILNDKAKKALQPLLCTIARFNLPVINSLKLFHTFISPIILYNVENWATLGDRKLRNFTDTSIFEETNDTKTDIAHRKFIKFILGVSKSCPNIATYGETGEIPLSLKGYRLMLNFWFRVTHLHENTLAKKALIENINLRTNWIITIEKLLKCLKLTECINNGGKFEIESKTSIRSLYKTYWQNKIDDINSVRLHLYRSIKDEFKTEDYLHLPRFEARKLITKIRCSDHSLEIEKGRHLNIPREERICKICKTGEVENEHHFLIECQCYEHLKTKYQMNNTDTRSLLKTVNPDVLGNYLMEAFGEREKIKSMGEGVG